MVNDKTATEITAKFPRMGQDPGQKLTRIVSCSFLSRKTGKTRRLEHKSQSAFCLLFPIMGQVLGQTWVRDLGGSGSTEGSKTAVLKQRIAGVKSAPLKQ